MNRKAEVWLNRPIYKTAKEWKAVPYEECDLWLVPEEYRKPNFWRHCNEDDPGIQKMLLDILKYWGGYINYDDYDRCIGAIPCFPFSIVGWGLGMYSQQLNFSRIAIKILCQEGRVKNTGRGYKLVEV